MGNEAAGAGLLLAEGGAGSDRTCREQTVWPQWSVVGAARTAGGSQTGQRRRWASWAGMRWASLAARGGSALCMDDGASDLGARSGRGVVPGLVADWDAGEDGWWAGPDGGTGSEPVRSPAPALATRRAASRCMRGTGRMEAGLSVRRRIHRSSGDQRDTYPTSGPHRRAQRRTNEQPSLSSLPRSRGRHVVGSISTVGMPAPAPRPFPVPSPRAPVRALVSVLALSRAGPTA
jgi:hypothetical protein